MENIIGDVTENIGTLIVEEATSDNNSSPGYDEIVNLVAESCEQLPGDLVVKILSKLPVKPLVRFKTVCKPWKLLLSSHVFINIHLHRKNPEIRCITLYVETENPVEDLSEEKQEDQAKEGKLLPFDKFDFIGVCKGIICLKPTHLEQCLFLWNPSIKEYSYLPLEYAAFCFGFFYLHKTQQYQIVGFRFSDHVPRSIDILTWTLGKTISMRVVKDVVVPGRITSSNHATCGTIMAWLSVDQNDDYSKHIVICYDVIEEKFSKMDVPPPISSNELRRCLRVLKDSIIMFVYAKIEPTFFDIWILSDEVSEGKSWEKYRKIGPLETGGIMKPIDVCWNDRRIMCTKVDNHNESRGKNSLFLYDLETDQVKEYEGYLGVCDLLGCVESLVSINSLVPCIKIDI